MSHAVYQTKAIIVGKKNMRESNILYVLYTERFGLVYVSAQSIRMQHSKMRFHMNLLSLVVVDIVQGKDIWRLTGVHQEISALSFSHTEWYPFLSRVSSLLIRLVKGEEANAPLWNDYETLYSYILEKDSEKDVDVFELIFVSRMLYHLGYWNRKEQYIEAEHPFRKEYFEEALASKLLIIREINQRISETQL